MPGLVTVLCHTACLGAWTSFWAPCRGTWPFADGFMVFMGGTEYSKPEGFAVDLLPRRELCSWRWHMNGRQCMEAAIEHLAWLLYPKFAHYTFTIAAFRIVRRRIFGSCMSLVGSNVLLKFSWLMVTLFGPCLPILNSLIALLAKIYSILLFGSNAHLLDVN
eukprot:6176443-Amphidinium_carterae.1